MTAKHIEQSVRLTKTYLTGNLLSTGLSVL